MNSENPEIDWVAVRHRCTAACELTRLRELAEKNVETRNEQIAQDSRPAFRLKATGQHTQTGFGVYQLSPFQDNGPHVRFTLEGEAIRIRGYELKTELDLDVTVRLDDDGSCALFVENKRRERWQVLHDALDELFFGLEPEDYI